MKNSIYVFVTCDWFCTDGSQIDIIMLQLSRAKPGNPASLLYKAAVSLCVSVCLFVCLFVCLYPPLFPTRLSKHTQVWGGREVREGGRLGREGD